MWIAASACLGLALLLAVVHFNSHETAGSEHSTVSCSGSVASAAASLWTIGAVDECSVRSLLAHAHRLRSRQQSEAAAFIAALTGETEEARSRVWELLPALHDNTDWPTVRAIVLRQLLLLSLSAPLPVVDVLSLGPESFLNEMFFATSLAAGHLTVASLTQREAFFPSDRVRQLHLPPELLQHIDIAALLLVDVMQLLRVKWVVSGDTLATLVIARAGHMLHLHGCRALHNCDAIMRHVLPALQRSGPVWPPVYPPPVLSKLVPGHEPVAPTEAVVAEDDGLRLIWPDEERIRAAWKQVCGGDAQCTVYMKREFSENSRGVASLMREEDIKEAVAKVFPRSTSRFGLADLNMTCKIARWSQNLFSMLFSFCQVESFFNKASSLHRCLLPFVSLLFMGN